MGIYDQRLSLLQREMEKQDIDCVAICNSPNLFYMTGYSPKKDERFQVAFVPRNGAPVLAVPKMNYEHSRKDCCIQDQRLWEDGTDMKEYLRGILRDVGAIGGRVAIDDTFEFRTLEQIRPLMGNAELILGSNLFTLLRMRKSADEIEMMKLSGELSDWAMEVVRDQVTSGKSEAEIRTWIEYELSMKGMRDGFSNLIVFGENTASVHHVSGDRVAKQGDAVYLDLGGAYHHYWSDITRSFHIGKPSARYVEAYNRVREAQQLAFESIKPGMRAYDVDKIARDYLAKYDLAKYFLHRLGHGMGLEGHELPNLAKNCDIILEPGMTFSCEPGVYISGEWGIRIEDTVCVTETGAISFNHYPKDLVIL